jgi:Protein of unknown function (DUF1648)
MMVLLVFAAGTAIVIGTIALTAARYRELPDRIPLHFGITGIADSYGPRAFIWLIVGMQLLCAAVYTVLYLSVGDRATLIYGVGFLAIFFWAQMQIISAAITGKNRMPIGLFWAVFVSILAATVIIARLFR